MDSFDTLMRTHQQLAVEFERLQKHLRKTIHYLRLFNKQAANNVEESKRSLFIHTVSGEHHLSQDKAPHELPENTGR
jgi:hypothetical protein